MNRMHDLGILHGDLRAGNIMVRYNEAHEVWDVRFIDLEWSGPIGVARYSPNMASTADGVPRHSDAVRGGIVQIEHDREQLRLVFEKECSY